MNDWIPAPWEQILPLQVQHTIWHMASRIRAASCRRETKIYPCQDGHLYRRTEYLEGPGRRAECVREPSLSTFTATRASARLHRLDPELQSTSYLTLAAEAGNQHAPAIVMRAPTWNHEIEVVAKHFQ